MLAGRLTTLSWLRRCASRPAGSTHNGAIYTRPISAKWEAPHQPSEEAVKLLAANRLCQAVRATGGSWLGEEVRISAMYTAPAVKQPANQANVYKAENAAGMCSISPTAFRKPGATGTQPAATATSALMFQPPWTIIKFHFQVSTTGLCKCHAMVTLLWMVVDLTLHRL